MNELQNRIKELRLKNKETQVSLAKFLGVAQNTLSYWEQGKYDVDTQSLQKIADHFNVSVDYLLGNKEKKSPELNIKNILPIKTKKVPLLGDIACGKPIWAEQTYREFINVSDDVDADFCLRASGDSMIGARIYDGDIVFIKQQDMVNNGEIAAVIIDNEATLKRVYYYPEKNKIVLNPENPAFEPLVYINEELNEIRILGKAVAFQSIVR